MSQSYRLVCHETKQKIWIGQGMASAMNFFYSWATMSALVKRRGVVMGPSDLYREYELT